MTIEARSLSRDFGDLHALDGVSFRVEKGEVFGYLGPNGAGKSTTVKVLLGLLAPTSGEVEVDGVDVARDPVSARERIGYVPEVQSLYESLSAEEHLRFVARMRLLDEATTERRSEALLSAFDLEGRAQEPIRSYSKGMRQKVAIALALVHRPTVLILDEPLAGLDVTTAMTLRGVIRGCASRGTSVLYCSHVLDVVEKVCDRAMILNHGKVVAAGTLEELRQETEGTSLDEIFRSVATEVDPDQRADALLEAIYA